MKKDPQVFALVLAAAIVSCAKQPEDSTIVPEAKKADSAKGCPPAPATSGPDPADPLIAAINRAASVLSDSGIGIRDYEWDSEGILEGIRNSKLSDKDFDLVLNRLFVVAPEAENDGDAWVAQYLEPNRPRLGTIAATPPATTADWASIDVASLDPTPLTAYQLPGEVRGQILHLIEPDRWVLQLDTWALRNAKGEVVAFKVVLVRTSCGDCLNGNDLVLSVTGQILSTIDHGDNIGYCC